MKAKDYYNKLMQAGVQPKDAAQIAVSTICCNGCKRHCADVETMKKTWDLENVDCPKCIQDMEFR